MQVQVRLFAGLRERAGAAQLELELPDGAVVGDALERLAALAEGIRVVAAVNHEYADEASPLHAGDELALIPPVSGGALGALYARVVADPLAPEELAQRVRDPRAGAIVTFVGVTRQVEALEYEAYAQMAERQITAIVQRAIERHHLLRAAVEHRVGTVPLSEPSVAIAVSAPHREQAFAGAREIIDELKANAPIWKKEEGQWAAGTTPQPRA
jgi:molybdopterin converting factor subunit 1